MQNACEVGWLAGALARAGPREGEGRGRGSNNSEGEIATRHRYASLPRSLACSLVHFTAENSWGRSMDGRERATRMAPARQAAMHTVEVGASPDQGNRGWSMKVETLCCHILLLTSHFGKVRAIAKGGRIFAFM